MPQPQSLRAQHQHHPKQANYEHPPPNLAQSQPQPVQSLGRPSSSSTSPQAHQHWQHHTGVEQKIQQNQEQHFHAQAPPSVVSSTFSATQTNEGRQISCEDIQLVQNLIERCLQLYMNQGEVIDTLLDQAKIECSFTSLVWQKLEEQNPDFFKAYYTRLKLKNQIMLFNHLLEQQAQLMQKTRMLPKSSPIHALTNDKHLFSMHQYPMASTGQQQASLTGAGRPLISVPPPSPPLLSGGSSTQDGCHTSFDSPESNLWDQGFIEMNGGVKYSCLMDVTSEVPPAMKSSSTAILFYTSPSSASAVPDSATFPFGTIGNPMEMTTMNIGLPAPLPLDTPFSTHEPNSQNGLVTLSIGTGDGDGNNVREVLGSLGPLPRNFSLSDLTAELGPNPDLGPLGSYSSPFLTPYAEAFLRFPEKDNLGNLFF
ncbi:hypothetical protein O6H91_12G051800 [Diphasiastrum complanatum]|uniref:Uncharacterized protein n=3 Tax=Diphasiastrum complanatum TaxID=34168 RepID=A0ACC2C1M7_DIPCM|nr:hypothetical protein O6H91_12G037700 [Diphasiastrum complanatum]KAJ7535964.1 hypothetical protein O6H91_12G051800 [Diphasiastrum complanatum]KAJ7535965.1 hypothetical protein O6H91_12G051800 [Diphasiastrum complanatum]